MAYDGAMMNVKAQVLLSAENVFKDWTAGRTTGPDIETMLAQAKTNDDWLTISALAMVIACIHVLKPPHLNCPPPLFTVGKLPYMYTLAQMVDANKTNEHVCAWLAGAKAGDIYDEMHSETISCIRV